MFYQSQTHPVLQSHLPDTLHSTRVILMIKRIKLHFPSIEINKPLPIHIISKAKFKFRGQLKLLPQISQTTTFRAEGRIVSIDSSITG